MASSHNQGIVDDGSQDRQPMPEKGGYVSRSSRFIRYIDGKKEYGKILKDSIKNDPYKMKEITDQGNPDGYPPILPFKRIQEESYLKGDDKKRFEADIDAMNAIMLGIPNDIYNSVDACKTTQAMWQRVQMLMQGINLSKQEQTSRLLDELDKFKGMLGESIESYYSHFSKIMNDLEGHGCLPRQFLATQSFLTHCNLNEITKRAAKTHDPLALIANHYVAPSLSHTQSPYYVTYPPSVADYDAKSQSFEIQGAATNDVPRISKDVGNAGRNTRGVAKNMGNVVKMRLANVPDYKELEELNATCIMMARLQSINNDSNAGPSYDSDYANEINDSQMMGNSENDTQDNNARDQTKVEFELLVRNVHLEAEKTNKMCKVFKKENDLLKIEL
ncbi:hypothetical protein Tco_0649928 [Tanacetum coccineum]